MMTHYEFHEYANIFPMLEGQELEALRADVDANGQINKIILYQGKILDGRNRYKVCEMLGIEPETIVYPGDDPLGLVLSQNLHRRHLTESQRAMVASNIANLPPHRPQNKSANLPTSISPFKNQHETRKVEKVDSGISQSEAAKQVNVSERLVRDAVKLRREAPPEIVSQVERGEKTIHAALDELAQPEKTGCGKRGKDGKLRPAKYKPRKKTVAKSSEPEEEIWETPIKMPEESGDFVEIPYPFCHIKMFSAIHKKVKNESDEVLNKVIEEFKLLAEIIHNLND